MSTLESSELLFILTDVHSFYWELKYLNHFKYIKNPDLYGENSVS